MPPLPSYSSLVARSVNDYLLGTEQVWLDLRRFYSLRMVIPRMVSPIEQCHLVRWPNWSGIYVFTRYHFVCVAILGNESDHSWGMVDRNEISPYELAGGPPWQHWEQICVHSPLTLWAVVQRVPGLRAYLHFTQPGMLHALLRPVGGASIGHTAGLAAASFE